MPELQIKSSGFPLVRDLVPEYLEMMARINKSATLRDKESVFRNHILPEIGDKHIDELSKTMLSNWRDTMLVKRNPANGEYYASAKLRQIRAFLNAFIEWCAERYDITNNLKYVKHRELSEEKSKRHIGPEERKIWSAEEFERFASVIDDPLYKAFFTYLFYTGRREGEVMALSPGDIHNGSVFYNKSVTAKGYDRSKSWEITSTKTGKGGEIAICPKVIKALDEYKKTAYYDKSNRFLFGGDRPLPFSTIKKRFNRYKSLAGVCDIRLHDLRHSFVSMMIHNGAILPVVAKLISDTQEQVIKTYSHMYRSDMTAVLENIQ